MKKLIAAAAAVLAVGSFTAGTANADDPTIYTIAGGADFTTLKLALDATGLKDAVDQCSDTEVTVFAPTNAAFDALFDTLGIDITTEAGQAALLALVADGTIADIVKYHVLVDEYVAEDVLALPSPTDVEMLNGDMATLTHPPVKINAATVTTANVQACNGVVHVIDKVLMPPADGDMGGDTGSGSTMAMLAAALLGAGLVVTTISRRRVTA